MEQDPNYIKNESSLLLSFVRAEEYNIERAAKRFVSFLEAKRSLFGVAKLTKTIITMEEDFNEDDMICATSGGLQLVPLKDQSGRHIMIHVSPLCPDNQSDESFVSILYTERCLSATICVMSVSKYNVLTY